MNEKMQCTITSKYLNHTGTVEKMQYGDGSLALTFTSLDGEPLSTLSVNLQAYGIVAPEGHVYVKNYAEDEGLAAALVAAGVASDTGMLAEFGPYGTTATLMKVAF
jgi:uncharacterized protein YdgA (DUF945 family)